MADNLDCGDLSLLALFDESACVMDFDETDLFRSPNPSSSGISDAEISLSEMSTQDLTTFDSLMDPVEVSNILKAAFPEDHCHWNCEPVLPELPQERDHVKKATGGLTNYNYLLDFKINVDDVTSNSVTDAEGSIDDPFSAMHCAGDFLLDNQGCSSVDQIASSNDYDLFTLLETMSEETDINVLSDEKKFDFDIGSVRNDSKNTFMDTAEMIADFSPMDYIDAGMATDFFTEDFVRTSICHDSDDIGELSVTVFESSSIEKEAADVEKVNSQSSKLNELNHIQIRPENGIVFEEPVHFQSMAKSPCSVKSCMNPNDEIVRSVSLEQKDSNKSAEKEKCVDLYSCVPKVGTNPCAFHFNPSCGELCFKGTEAAASRFCSSQTVTPVEAEVTTTKSHLKPSSNTGKSVKRNKKKTDPLNRNFPSVTVNGLSCARSQLTSENNPRDPSPIPLTSADAVKQNSTKIYVKMGEASCQVQVASRHVNKLMVKDLLKMTCHAKDENEMTKYEEYCRNWREVWVRRRKRLSQE